METVTAVRWSSLLGALGSCRPREQVGGDPGKRMGQARDGMAHVSLSSSSLRAKRVFCLHPLSSASPSYKRQRGQSVADPILAGIHLYPIFPAWPLQEQKPKLIFLNQRLAPAWHRDRGTRASLSEMLPVLCTLSVAFCLPFHSS